MKKSILTKFLLGEIEERLSKSEFLRIHRSFIVARDKISAFTVIDIVIDNKLVLFAEVMKDWYCLHLV